MKKKKVVFFSLVIFIFGVVFFVNNNIIEGAYNKDEVVVLQKADERVEAKKSNGDVEEKEEENLGKIDKVILLSDEFYGAEAINWSDNNTAMLKLDRDHVTVRSDKFVDLGKTMFVKYDGNKEEAIDSSEVKSSALGIYMSPSKDRVLVNNVSTYRYGYEDMETATIKYYCDNYIYDLEKKEYIDMNVFDSYYRNWLSDGKGVVGIKSENYDKDKDKVVPYKLPSREDEDRLLSLNVFDIQSKKVNEIIKCDDIIKALGNEYNEVSDMYYIDSKSKLIVIAGSSEKESMFLIDLNNLENFKLIGDVEKYYCVSFKKFNERYVKFNGLLSETDTSKNELEYLIDVYTGEVICSGEFIEKYNQNKILYKEDEGIFIKDLNSGETKKIMGNKNIMSVSVSGDSKRIAYWVKNPDDGEIRIGDIENDSIVDDRLIFKLNYREEPSMMLNNKGDKLLVNMDSDAVYYTKKCYLFKLK